MINSFENYINVIIRDVQNGTSNSYSIQKKFLAPSLEEFYKENDINASSTCNIFSNDIQIKYQDILNENVNSVVINHYK